MGDERNAAYDVVWALSGGELTRLTRELFLGRVARTGLPLEVAFQAPFFGQVNFHLLLPSVELVAGNRANPALQAAEPGNEPDLWYRIFEEDDVIVDFPFVNSSVEAFSPFSCRSGRLSIVLRPAYLDPDETGTEVLGFDRDALAVWLEFDGSYPPGLSPENHAFLESALALIMQGEPAGEDPVDWTNPFDALAEGLALFLPARQTCPLPPVQEESRSVPPRPPMEPLCIDFEMVRHQDPSERLLVVKTRMSSPAISTAAGGEADLSLRNQGEPVGVFLSNRFMLEEVLPAILVQALLTGHHENLQILQALAPLLGLAGVPAVTGDDIALPDPPTDVDGPIPIDDPWDPEDPTEDSPGDDGAGAAESPSPGGVLFDDLVALHFGRPFQLLRSIPFHFAGLPSLPSLAEPLSDVYFSYPDAPFTGEQLQLLIAAGYVPPNGKIISVRLEFEDMGNSSRFLVHLEVEGGSDDPGGIWPYSFIGTLKLELDFVAWNGNLEPRIVLSNDSDLRVRVAGAHLSQAMVFSLARDSIRRALDDATRAVNLPLPLAVERVVLDDLYIAGGLNAAVLGWNDDDRIRVAFTPEAALTWTLRAGEDETSPGLAWDSNTLDAMPGTEVVDRGTVEIRRALTTAESDLRDESQNWSSDVSISKDSLRAMAGAELNPERMLANPERKVRLLYLRGIEDQHGVVVLWKDESNWIRAMSRSYRQRIRRQELQVETTEDVRTVPERTNDDAPDWWHEIMVPVGIDESEQPPIVVEETVTFSEPSTETLRTRGTARLLLSRWWRPVSIVWTVIDMDGAETELSQVAPQWIAIAGGAVVRFEIDRIEPLPPWDPFGGAFGSRCRFRTRTGEDGAFRLVVRARESCTDQVFEGSTEITFRAERLRVHELDAALDDIQTMMDDILESGAEMPSGVFKGWRSTAIPERATRELPRKQIRAWLRSALHLMAKSGIPNLPLEQIAHSFETFAEALPEYQLDSRPRRSKKGRGVSAAVHDRFGTRLWRLLSCCNTWNRLCRRLRERKRRTRLQ